MDIGKLLASQFSARDTEEKSAKQAEEQRVRTELEAKERNYEALKELFGPIVESFNASVGSGPRFTMEARNFFLRFDHGFSTVLLIQVGEAHVELSRGGSQGRKTKSFPKPFFFIGYSDEGKPLFSESYHIESAWITGEEFAAFCLREALNLD